MSTQSSIPVLLGVILPNLRAYGQFVADVAQTSYVRATEFTFTAPLYKGTPQIVEALKTAFSGIEKFDVYFKQAILDETTRLSMAQAFRKLYLAQRPRSEGQDVYLASGDVLNFIFELEPPANFPDPERAFRACAEFSHDDNVLAQAWNREPVAKDARSGRMKLFLEDPRNARRRDVPSVGKMCTAKGIADPFVFELAIVGALPGLFIAAVEPVARKHGGGMVLLPG